MQRFSVWLGVVAVLAVPMLGCGKKASDTAAEKAVESAMAAQGQEADVSIKEDAVQFRTKDSQMSFGEGTKIPEDWPSDVPVYKGLTIMSAMSAPEGANLQGTTSDSADKVAAFYKEQAGKNGWTEDTVFTQAEMTSLIYKKESRTLSVIATKSGSETTVAISLANQ